MNNRLQEIISTFSQEEQAMVSRACDIAAQHLKDRTRENGHPFFEHPENTAVIAHDMLGLDAVALTAIMLHEAGRFSCGKVSDLNKGDFLESCRGHYPAQVLEIVRNLNNIAGISMQETNLDAEKYRKLIVGYSVDPRAVLIKLADRLDVMRNLSNLSTIKRRAKVMESMLLYIPIAHQLGIYHLKSEMEDIFLRYTEPDAYRSIRHKLKETEADRVKLANEFVEPLKKKLDELGIKYKLKARTKSPYSIWKKMQAKGLPFEEIFDVFAIRFIIDCPPDKELENELCWKVYSLVTEEYEPDTSRLRDWITVPKKNGYESLHTTVANRDGASLEVQIRTKRMDDIAENGDAAHWAYKGISSKAALSDWLVKVRHRIENPNSEEYEMAPVVFNEIMVFTPTGELRQLKAGACVLDFAFEIHSNLGLKCTGGRINGKIVPIREKLHTGDVVDIISSKNQKPSADWLNFVVSGKARSKIRQKLNEEEAKRAKAGREILIRRLKNWKLEFGDDELSDLIKKLKFKTNNDFFGSIGSGQTDPIVVKEYINDKRQALRPVEAAREARSTNETPLATFLDYTANLKGMEFKPAKCCNPGFGDEIFGFLTIRDGIKIHRDDCPNAARLKENYPYRVVILGWKQRKNGEQTDTHKGGKGK